ncbi:MAG: hypothetical protein US76_04215 [Parcubacteria group bacterium GW2011_GWA2_38_13b]|nr:MAG: hypothetical protein US76_04215 [Parcubacteria group bacterium GW2011_GWA2_38_13b]
MNDRKLIVKIKRISGRIRREYFNDFIVDEQRGMSVLALLDEIQTGQDSSIYYDGQCGCANCGICAIKINGRPKLACKTQTADLPYEIVLEPLDFFPIVKDLAVDKSEFFNRLEQKMEAWVHRQKEFNPEKEDLMVPELADALYENERCVKCGICVSACAAASFGKFIGASGCITAHRFLQDPRNEDLGARQKLINILSSDDGLWGCHAIEACDNFCPKEIPLGRQLALARKETLKILFKEWLGLAKFWRRK